MTALVVGATLVAGAIGALLRYGATTFAARRGHRLPWAVLVVNVAGCLIGGVVLGLVERGVIGDDVRLVVLSGLAGGLTTFSTWSTETVQLAIEGRWRTAAGSVLLNLVLGIGAVVLALVVTTALA